MQVIKHGTPGAYTNNGCRCAFCKEAWAKYQREYSARRRKHGTQPQTERKRNKLKHYEFLEKIAQHKLKKGCKKCGYNRCASALHFHHRDPATKVLEITRALKRSVPKHLVIEEIRKCDVLCANCHAELHAGCEP